MNFFDSILTYYWSPAIFTVFISFFFVILAIRLFPKIGLLDRPQKYGLMRSPIPYYGGIAIFLAFLTSVLIFVPMNMSVIGLLIGAFIIVVLGFFDDLFCLSPWVRLLVQFVACLVLVFFGIGLLSINIPFLGVIDFGGVVIGGVVVLSAIFTIVWVMSIVNMMNLLDGVSGLTSGVSFVASLTIFFLSIHPGIHESPDTQLGVAIIALIIAMVSLIFLVFDFPKPKILMGDTGSTFLGFVIAVLAIFSGGKVATAFLVLGIPILDMVWVILRRLLAGSSPLKGDLKHLHHRLLSLGFPERKVVVLYLIISGILGGSAVMFVSGQQKLFIIIAFVVLMALLAGALVFIPRRKEE
jgi:UDP-GlcNAc:undecaprenyl-phosphate GlcNAc-1-phosphate transferase